MQVSVDYTNALADLTVGYMGGDGEQWLLVRNPRGQELLDLLGDDVRLSAPTSRGRRRAAVTGFRQNVERAAGGLPLRAIPGWLRPLVAWLQPRLGPRGLEFARARVEMKAIETVLHLRAQRPARLKSMVPRHLWDLVCPYGLAPTSGEIATHERSSKRRSRAHPDARCRRFEERSCVAISPEVGARP